MLKNTADGQESSDENRMYRKPGRPRAKSTSSRHLAIKPKNDDGISSETDSVWHPQPIPSTSMPGKSARTHTWLKNAESDSSSTYSTEDLKKRSTWKHQRPLEASHSKIKKQKTRVESSSDMEMWHPVAKPTAGNIKKSCCPKTTLIQHSDSESSSSEHGFITTPRRKNTSDIKFKQTTKPLTKPTTSHQNNLQDQPPLEASHRKFKKGKICQGTWYTLANPTTGIIKKSCHPKTTLTHSDSDSSSSENDFLTELNSGISSKKNSDNKFKQTEKQLIKPTTSHQNNLKQNTDLKQSRAALKELAKPSTSQQIIGFQPDHTSTSTHIGVTRDNQHKYSIMKRNITDMPQSTPTSKDAHPSVPGKRQPVINRQFKRNKLAEAPSVRRSPRKQYNLSVSSAKNQVRSDKHKCQQSSRAASPYVGGSQQRRQLLNQTRLIIEEDNDNNEDGSEKHSPLVRGKTRSRTRYYSTVGAVYCPPEPEDYIQWRQWPADVGLVYAEYPRDFPQHKPQLPSPTSNKEGGAHNALHCVIALVAFTAAANQRGSILGHEINLIQFMLNKMAEFVCWEKSAQNRDSSFGSQIYHNVENMQISESVHVESTSDSKISFLEKLGLSKHVEEKEVVITPLSTIEEETSIWIKAVNELIVFIEHVILKQCREPSEEVEEALVDWSTQCEGGATVLIRFLNELMLSTSLLYSLVCNVPHETVKNYIDSQTHEVVTEWLTDMLTNILNKSV